MKPRGELLQKIQVGIDGGVELMKQLRTVCSEVHAKYHGTDQEWVQCQERTCKSSVELILKIEKELAAP